MNEQVYKDNILDHYKNPRNAGKLEDADFTAKLANYSCGDETIVSLKVEKKTGKIIEIRHQTVGCAICMASTSILSEELIGKSIQDIKKLDKDFVLGELGITLTPSRLKCALLPLEAIKMALGKRSQD